jgi:ankyrin repeat protein
VKDYDTFRQNLLFSSVLGPNEDKTIQIMTYLIEKGVDPLEKDNLKQTPLFYAAREGRSKVVQFLVD